MAHSTSNAMDIPKKIAGAGDEDDKFVVAGMITLKN